VCVCVHVCVRECKCVTVHAMFGREGNPGVFECSCKMVWVTVLVCVSTCIVACAHSNPFAWICAWVLAYVRCTQVCVYEFVCVCQSICEGAGVRVWGCATSILCTSLLWHLQARQSDLRPCEVLPLYESYSMILAHSEDAHLLHAALRRAPSWVVLQVRTPRCTGKSLTWSAWSRWV